MKKFIFSSLLLLSCIAASAVTVLKSGNLLFHGIVTPEKPVPGVTFAAKELAYHIQRATGKKIPVISESAVKPKQKYFYLGSCKANAALNAGKLPWNTGIIKVNANSIQIAGLDGSSKLLHDTNSTGTLFAVYEFLEKYFGVRWIWPGKSGEVIPRRRYLVIKEGEFTVKPLLRSSDFRSNPPIRQGAKGWSSPKVMKRYFDEERIWLLRHRFSRDRSVMGGHAFTKYYQTYNKKHPEFFSLLPNGKRILSPYKGRKFHYASSCVTNPTFVKTVVFLQSQPPSHFALPITEVVTPSLLPCAFAV